MNLYPCIEISTSKANSDRPLEDGSPALKRQKVKSPQSVWVRKRKRKRKRSRDRESERERKWEIEEKYLIFYRAHIITAHWFAEQVLEKEEDRRGRSFSSVAAAGVITGMTTLFTSLSLYIYVDISFFLSLLFSFSLTYFLFLSLTLVCAHVSRYFVHT